MIETSSSEVTGVGLSCHGLSQCAAPPYRIPHLADLELLHAIPRPDRGQTLARRPQGAAEPTCSRDSARTTCGGHGAPGQGAWRDVARHGLPNCQRDHRPHRRNRLGRGCRPSASRVFLRQLRFQGGFPRRPEDVSDGEIAQNRVRHPKGIAPPSAHTKPSPRQAHLLIHGSICHQRLHVRAADVASAIERIRIE